MSTVASISVVPRPWKQALAHTTSRVHPLPTMPSQSVAPTLSMPANKIASVVGRVDYARVRVVEGKVEPLAVSGASILSSMTRADGFVLVPAESEGHAPGAEVEVFLYDLP